MLQGTLFGGDAERLLRREVEAAAAVREARRPLAEALSSLAADPLVGPLAFPDGV